MQWVSMGRGYLVVVMTAALHACSFEDVPLDGRACPCSGGYVCDEVKNVCVANDVVSSTTDTSTSTEQSSSASSGGGGSSSMASTGGGGNVPIGGSDIGGAAPGSLPTVILEDGPVHYWRMDDEGSTMADIGSNPVDGEYFGSTQPTNGLIAGHNGARKFNGGLALVPPVADLQFNNYDAYTIELWFNADSHAVNPDYQRLVSNEYVDSGNRNGFDLLYFYDQPRNVGPYLAAERWETTAESAVTTTSAGKDVYVAVTYNSAVFGEELIIYVDGLPGVKAEAYDPLDVHNDAFAIASDPAMATSPFHGVIDEVAVYDRTLTAAEITKHHQAANIPE